MADAIANETEKLNQVSMVEKPKPQLNPVEELNETSTASAFKSLGMTENQIQKFENIAAIEGMPSGGKEEWERQDLAPEGMAAPGASASATDAEQGPAWPKELSSIEKNMDGVVKQLDKVVSLMEKKPGEEQEESQTSKMSPQAPKPTAKKQDDPQEEKEEKDDEAEREMKKEVIKMAATAAGIPPEFAGEVADKVLDYEKKQKQKKKMQTSQNEEEEEEVEVEEETASSGYTSPRPSPPGFAAGA